MRDGRSELNVSVYHDRYRRTPDGRKFAERVYEIRYLDTTPVAGSATPRSLRRTLTRRASDRFSPAAATSTSSSSEAKPPNGRPRRSV